LFRVNKSPHPSIGQGLLKILPIQNLLLHVDRRAGGVNPTLPDFLGLFCLLHDSLLLSQGFYYSVKVGKFMGSTQIPPTFLALCLVVISVLLIAV
jgi:hypothetical protein